MLTQSLRLAIITSIYNMHTGCVHLFHQPPICFKHVSLPEDTFNEKPPPYPAEPCFTCCQASCIPLGRLLLEGWPGNIYQLLNQQSSATCQHFMLLPERCRNSQNSIKTEVVCTLVLKVMSRPEHLVGSWATQHAPLGKDFFSKQPLCKYQSVKKF